jgi:hypothetical protein
MPTPETEVKQAEGPGFSPEDDEGSESAAKPLLSAAEALDKLRKGITLENVRIEKLVFKGEFTEPVRLRHCVLVQPRFEGAVFRAEVTFARCTVERPQFGKKTEFTQGLSLVGSTLKWMQLVRITVQGPFTMEYAHCRGKLLVADSRFEGKVRFWETRFNGWVEFKTCEFVGEADFRSFHAEEGFVFYNCKFDADCLLRGSSVAKKFEAKGSRFEAMLDLSKAKLHDYCYLEDIVQGDKMRFAFLNTVGEHVRIHTKQLVGRLASEQGRRYADAMHEYAFLKQSFAALHRYDQEDWAYYRFKVNQRRNCNRSWWRPWTKLTQFLEWVLLDHGCGYCTDPFRAVRTAGLIILLFGLVYAAGIESFTGKEMTLPFEGAATDLLNRSVIGMFKSVVVFTSGLSSLNDMARGWMNLPLIVESLLGTLLWGLFIVAFSRKVIR